MWRLPGCTAEDFLVARRLAARSHTVHHKLHTSTMLYNGNKKNKLYIVHLVYFLEVAYHI